MLVGVIGGIATERFLTLTWVSIILYAIPYLLGTYSGASNVIESLRKHKIDIDLLMLLAAVGAAVIGEYYEGGLLLFLFALSNLLQDLSIEKTRSAISALAQLRPDSATVHRNGTLERVALKEIAIGEHIVLYPGERAGLDGCITEGTAMLDRSFITGESQYISAKKGMNIEAGTLIMGGSITMKVQRVAANSFLARIIRLVEDARKKKTSTQRFLERYEGSYAAVVIGMTVLTFFILRANNIENSAALYRAITLMVALSPCAIIISTPVTMLSAIAVAARRGILIKGGIYLERATNIQTMACDKTGTLTIGRPIIADVELLDIKVPIEHGQKKWSGNRDEFITLVASIEARSEHALAHAVARQAQQNSMTLQKTDTFRAIAGQGVEARIAEQHFWAGNLNFLQHDTCYGIEIARQKIEAQLAAHHTAIVVAQIISDQQSVVLGIMAFADTLRPGAPYLIAELQRRGIESIIISGDAAPVVHNIARATGIKQVYAEVLPEEKQKIICDLQQRHGRVAMLGDGVNDAPALAQADIGIAIGRGGVDVALESADIVLMTEHIEALPFIIDLSRRVRRTLIINAVAILLLMICMGVTTLLNLLPLPLAVVGHEGSTVLAALYGLHLLIGKRAVNEVTTSERKVS